MARQASLSQSVNPRGWPRSSSDSLRSILHPSRNSPPRHGGSRRQAIASTPSSNASSPGTRQSELSLERDQKRHSHKRNDRASSLLRTEPPYPLLSERELPVVVDVKPRYLLEREDPLAHPLLGQQSIPDVLETTWPDDGHPHVCEPHVALRIPVAVQGRRITEHFERHEWSKQAVIPDGPRA